MGLVTTLVFSNDHAALSGEDVVRTVYDCAAGTGGFLSSAIEQVYEWNPNARLIPYAQELNPETYAISVADKLIQGYDTKNINLGNTLSHDQLLENDWLESIIALPNDLVYNTGIGTYVWVLSNHKQVERKGKVQLIDASAMHAPMRKSLGSKRKLLSEAQIADIARQHDDLLDVATSKLFDTSDFGYRRITVERPLRLRFAVTPDTLAAYRVTKGAEHEVAIAALLERGGHFDDLPGFLKATGVKKLGKGAQKAVFACFGMKCLEANPVKDSDGSLLPDTDLRENENVPLKQDIHDYFQREVLPHVADAWIDENKRDEKDGQIGIVGYEINFNRYFYQYVPPRKLANIDFDLQAVEAEIAALLGEVTAC